MGLSCSCGSDYDWYGEPSQKGQQPLNTKRGRRCASCNKIIKVGEIAQLIFTYYINDAGDEIHKADIYECEECDDLRGNLTELGYCVEYKVDIRELTREYAEIHEAIKV